MMQNTTRSLLEELETLANNRDQTSVIENRANNIISSAINLLEMIYKQYPADRCQVLERKLLSAIKSRDRTRFSKTLRKNNASK